MIRVTKQISIASWELSESFGCASGPGGRNINNVEVTAAAGNRSKQPERRALHLQHEIPRLSRYHERLA